MYATSTDMLHWELKGPWQGGRPGRWDAHGLAAGPPPMKLSDGNIVYFYNTDAGVGAFTRCQAGCSLIPPRLIRPALFDLDGGGTDDSSPLPSPSPSVEPQCEPAQVGWMILDGRDPTKLLARVGDTPLLSPLTPYELGNSSFYNTQGLPLPQQPPPKRAGQLG